MPSDPEGYCLFVLLSLHMLRCPFLLAAARWAGTVLEKPCYRKGIGYPLNPPFGRIEPLVGSGFASPSRSRRHPASLAVP